MGIVCQIEKGIHKGKLVIQRGGYVFHNWGEEPIHLLRGSVDGLFLRGVESDESVGKALGGIDDGIELGGADELVVAIFLGLHYLPIFLLFRLMI
jgi:hypothetical protein